MSKAFENLDIDGDALHHDRDLNRLREGWAGFMIPAWIAQRDLDQDGAVGYDDFLHSVASSFAPARAKAKNKDDDSDDDAIASALGVLG